MEKKIVLTGIQPSGEITLGNYIGAIKQMERYQDEYESFIFIADMHAITVPQDKKELHNNIRSLVALYIACGIDPGKNTIYIQSENKYIANISWILECNTYYGELSRMTQFKDKSLKNKNFTAGLLTYPVLMAADILAMDANYVPVGMDQKQHLEITRDIAIRFNKKYGETFVVPEPLISESGTKIMNLQDPSKKMSKSDDDKGIIKILEKDSVIRKKIMSATTDSETCVNFAPDSKPGISNLINIVVSLTDMSIKDVENMFKESNYGAFKKYVADLVVDTLIPIQKRYKELLNSKELDKILDAGKGASSKLAEQKLDQIKKAIGLYR